MSNKYWPIKLKKSAVAGKVPALDDLVYGELAINYADGKLYYKTSSNNIDVLNQQTAVKTTDALGTVISDLGVPSTINFNLDTGLDVVDLGNGEVRVDYSGLSLGLLDADNNILASYRGIKTVKYDSSGFDLANLGAGVAKVSLKSAFNKIVVDNAELTADGVDSVKFVAGRNVSITADSTTSPQEVKFEVDVDQLNADLLDGLSSEHFYSPDNPPAVFERFEFTNSLQWVVNHNRGTDQFVEKLLDEDGNRFFARVRVVDLNTFVVDLTSAISGKVDVLFLV